LQGGREFIRCRQLETRVGKSCQSLRYPHKFRDTSQCLLRVIDGGIGEIKSIPAEGRATTARKISPSG
jgi:hypothetical protein